MAAIACLPTRPTLLGQHNRRQPAHAMTPATFRSRKHVQHQRVIARSYTSNAGEDPYAVLGIPPSSDEQTIMRAYRKRMSENKTNEAEKARIEAAHTTLMMRSLTSRLQGKVTVDKEILYADRARFFPWRPRLYPGAQRLVLYSAAAQAAIVAYGALTSSFPLPVIYAAMAGAIGQLLKQNSINPPASTHEGTSPEGIRNIIRAFFLAFLATTAGSLISFTLPDGVASLFGKTLPYWVYANQSILLTLGTAVSNFVSVALFR